MREYGSEHPAIVLPDGYFNQLNKLGREVTYLRSGREALLLSAIAACDAKEKTILFPAYCCWSMSAPFEKAGWTVVHYKLNEDLTVDTVYLRSLLMTYKPQAVLTMNFYGSASTDEAVRMVKEFDKRIKVIEDFSHCTFSIHRIFNNQVDIYVSSIRKSVGVCDGAVILSKVSMPLQYLQEELKDFSDKRYEAQTDKMRYTWSKDQNSKRNFLEAIRECEDILNEFNAVRRISERAIKMLSLVNGEKIAYARKKNMEHLWTLLNGKVKMVSGLERCFDGAPFALPILVDNRDEVQKWLAENGLYTPVLWPLCDKAKVICEHSNYVSEHMLAIPIDQRYDWDDIEDISKIIMDMTKRFTPHNP